MTRRGRLVQPVLWRSSPPRPPRDAPPLGVQGSRRPHDGSHCDQRRASESRRRRFQDPPDAPAQSHGHTQPGTPAQAPKNKAYDQTPCALRPDSSVRSSREKRRIKGFDCTGQYDEDDPLTVPEARCSRAWPDVRRHRRLNQRGRLPRRRDALDRGRPPPRPNQALFGMRIFTEQRARSVINHKNVTQSVVPRVTMGLRCEPCVSAFAPSARPAYVHILSPVD